MGKVNDCIAGGYWIERFTDIDRARKMEQGILLNAADQRLSHSSFGSVNNQFKWL